jgi:hypothetical protein
VKAYTPLALAAAGAVLEIPFDAQAQSRKLGADLVMPAGEKIGFNKKILVPLACKAQREDGLFAAFLFFGISYGFVS